MKVFLNSVPITPPVGLDALTLHKTRNPRTWGFLYRRIGFAEFGEVTFVDPASVRTLRDAFNRDGLNAEVEFTIKDDQGRPIYEAYIDFATHSFSPGKFSCGFRDDNRKTELESSFASLFSIPATQTISLPGQLLTADAMYVLSRSTVSRSVAGSVLHSIPFQRKDEREQAVTGTLLSVSQPLLLEPIYRNDTSQPVTIQLSGVVNVAFQTSTNFNVSLGYQLQNESRIVATTPLTTYAVSTAGTSIITAINTVITVQSKTSVTVGWISATANAVFSASYNPATGIAVQQPVIVPETNCNGLYAYDLLRELTRRCGPGFEFRSDFFLRGNGAQCFITNGANLRGINRPLKVSFSDIFDQLNAIFNLSKTLDGRNLDTLRIETKVNQFNESGRTILPTITEVKYKVNTDWLASEVFIGYGEWKGSSLTSAIEKNGSRSYRTSIATFRNSLDLRSQLIASGTLIEETRRKQFSPETSGSGKAEEHDDDLFVVMVDKFNRAKVTPFYNSEISPEFCLSNWLPLLTYCKNLTLETYEGGLNDNEPTSISTVRNAALIGNLTATVTVPLSMFDYEHLNDWIQFSDGEQTRTGILMDAAWSNTVEGPLATLILSC